MIYKNGAMIMGILGTAALLLVHPCAVAAGGISLPSGILLPALPVRPADDMTHHVQPDLVNTPFGVVHKDCVLGVESGSTIKDTGHSVLITYANGTQQDLTPCAATPFAKALRKQVGDTPAWHGWYEHFWMLADYVAPSPISSFQADWQVPDMPANMSASNGSPWPYVPTQSWWFGLESTTGDLVLQPVVELNDLNPGGWDAASWNCCPQGYVTHSAPLTNFQSGATVTGSVTQTPPGQNIYEIVTTVNGQSTTLTADLTSMSGWNGNWAFIAYEAYFITDCSQLTDSLLSFTNIQLSAANDDDISPVNLPWQVAMQTGAGEQPPICNGKFETDSAGDVYVGFST